MPGARDPASYMQPQQPLFRGLFPVASTLSTFSPVTNPHAFTVNGVRCVGGRARPSPTRLTPLTCCNTGGVGAGSFLGGSGQTLDDVFRYSRVEDRLQLLEQTLHWRHVAPTAPDTLGAHAPATRSQQTPGLTFAVAGSGWMVVGAFPLAERDPFILPGDAPSCPHVYFMGNQPAYGTRLVHGTCIPRPAFPSGWG